MQEKVQTSKTNTNGAFDFGTKEEQDARLKLMAIQFKGELNKLMDMQKSKYVLTEENKKVIQILLNYFSFHEDFLKTDLVQNPTFTKGILLAGNVGSGKTFLFEVIKRSLFALRTRGNCEWAKSFNTYFAKDMPHHSKERGFSYVDALTEPNVKCTTVNQVIPNIINIEDIGAEKKDVVVDYGTKLDVVDYLIDKRSIHKSFKGLITHGTTNLGIEKLTELYDSRFSSRVYDMFNIVKLGATREYTDFRKF